MNSSAPTRPLMEGDETKKTARPIQRAGNFGSVWFDRAQTNPIAIDTGRPPSSERRIQ